MQSHENVINTAFGVFEVDPKVDAKMARHLAGVIYPQKDTLDLIDALGVKQVVDVGAHIGTVSIPLARKGFKIIAFEPNPDSYDQLKRNALLNGVHGDLRNKGLAEKIGRANSAARHGGNAGAHTLIEGDTIEVSTLDMELTSADFIKIDVEGMELSVLRGAKALLVRSHPMLFLEINLSALRMHTTRLAQLEDFLKKLHYQLYIPVGKQLYKVGSLSLATFFTTPRACLFGGPAAPFDVLALPSNRPVPLPTHTFLSTLIYLIKRYIVIHYAKFSHT